MPTTILGLDVGGANLKAATTDQRAITLPFPLWKQPDKLPTTLAELVAQFPGIEELAVTMTGELCDCFETKRDGVNAILSAVRFASGGRRIRVWSTDGVFVDTEAAKRNHLKVAAANWHALATFAGRFAPHHGGLLLDIGSTTSDIIPLNHGVPSTYGTTDWERLEHHELVYLGVSRTPVCAVYPDRVCAELFATTRDVYTVLGLLQENPDDRDTADGRSSTFEHSLARLARMLGGDRETLSDDHIVHFATRVHTRILETISSAARAAYYDTQNPPELHTVIISGAGEFLARRVIDRVFQGAPIERIISLNDELGPVVSACAPAYAVAVLASESRS
ncbi:MAG: H4MPT-linked C1 transfer pathway protein [Planctomycetaceae bacterium]|nr:H4MPT-linked C1 transfer pathway protein [Planctomycetaceae bacterium]